MEMSICNSICNSRVSCPYLQLTYVSYQCSFNCTKQLKNADWCTLTFVCRVERWSVWCLHVCVYMCVFTCVCMFLYVCVCDVCRDPRSRSRRYRKVSQLYWKQSIFCRVSMFIIIVRIQTFSNYSSTKKF